VTKNIIVLFDQAKFEAKPPVFEIRCDDGSYTRWSLRTGSAGTKYSSCRVRYPNPSSGKRIEGIAYADDYKEGRSGNQQLEVTAKVNSIGEAKALAAKRLRLHNKYGVTARFTFPGNPNLVAGITVKLSRWGLWSGKYIVSRARHTVDRGGYSTEVELRRVLEG
jgi:phage protein D